MSFAALEISCRNGGGFVHLHKRFAFRKLGTLFATAVVFLHMAALQAQAAFVTYVPATQTITWDPAVPIDLLIEALIATLAVGVFLFVLKYAPRIIISVMKMFSR